MPAGDDQRFLPVNVDDGSRPEGMSLWVIYFETHRGRHRLLDGQCIWVDRGRLQIATHGRPLSHGERLGG